MKALKKRRGLVGATQAWDKQATLQNLPWLGDDNVQDLFFHIRSFPSV
jgi:hypothetical protein